MLEEEEEVGEGSTKTTTSSWHCCLQLYFCVKYYVKNDFGHPGEFLYTMTSIFIRKRHLLVSSLISYK